MATLTRSDGAKSVGTKPFAAARQAYDNGMSLRRIQRRFHMTEGEMRDMAPEEFPAETASAEGSGGY